MDHPHEITESVHEEFKVSDETCYTLEKCLKINANKRLFGILTKRDSENAKQVPLEHKTKEELEKEEIKYERKDMKRADQEYLNFCSLYFHRWVSAGECYHLARKIQAGILDRLEKFSFVGISGENSVEWFCVDFACIFVI